MEGASAEKPQPGGLKDRRGAADVVALVLLQAHPVDQTQREKDREDAIDGRLGDGDDEAPAGAEHAGALTGEGVAVGDVLENREHGHAVEGGVGERGFTRRGRERAAKDLDVGERARLGERIEPDGTLDAGRDPAEEGVVEAPDVQERRESAIWPRTRDPGQGLGDAPALEDAVERAQRRASGT